MEVVWIKVAVIAVACVVMLLLTGVFFKKTIAIDPRGEFGAAGQMASLNGTVTLYTILAAAAVLLTRYVSPLALYVGGVILAAILVFEIISFGRAKAAFGKNIKKFEQEKLSPDALQAARGVTGILFRARLCADIFLSFLTLMVWL